ncbi:hypothetical protein SAMN05216249_11252 [Acetitomaculum ruminis DSM 5522]|uniref:Right handed beta helix region n=1 Tax=Acetitomaculum ruminis DSM 5522 TaxID=1120918 RepID=A0A1I0Z0J3_9FIRM|nr:hypothetical protein [Acetitomaculum ruminis]SFB19124.1 hypothetical protein SAMN05216249_11252 [Acetitomaculum ruminis DSM 5522]
MKKKLLIALLALTLCVAVPVGVANFNQKTDEKAATNSISANENETDNSEKNNLESDSKSKLQDKEENKDVNSSNEEEIDKNSEENKSEDNESLANQDISDENVDEETSGNENTDKTGESDKGVVAGMYKEVEKEFVDYNTADTSSSRLKVNETLSDQYIVPDKYSTGVKGTLTVVNKGTVCNGVPIYVSGNIGLFNPKYVDIPDTVTISGYDFESFKEFTVLKCAYDKNKTVIFENCKFSRFRTAIVQDKVKFIFKNCTFQNFYGSNAELKNCYLGGVMRDCTNPFQNVTYDSCMFADICKPLESGVLHSDGCQIYANKDAAAINIHFKNCRFEMPRFRFSNTESQNTVNTCIGLMLEYNTGDDITWERCVVNGGGYSIYLSGKHGCTFTNASLKDIRVGCSHEYGILYRDSTGGAEYVNVRDTDSLYVGSVWKDKDGIHMSVTNDTNEERKLMVYTNKGWRKYNVAACKTCNQLTIDKYSYKDMPFDIDITIPEDIDFLVCYDTTSDITKQIRFVNMGDSEVFVYDYEKYLSKVVSEE